MKKLFSLFLIILNIGLAAQERKDAGNPVFPGWYADPEGTIFGNMYWIFPTYSGESDDPGIPAAFSEHQSAIRKNTINPQYLKQTFLDAFSSKDLVTWEKHPHVLDVKNVSWAGYAVWAPSITQKGDKYYLFFGANDIQNNEQPGGIGIAVADRPEGPYTDYLGKPLVDRFYHGAQPIDQFAFRDTDGQYYLIYGGWRHCNIGRLKEDFTGFVPFEDGTIFKSITPEKYVEGPFMLVRKGKYYLMWSEGGWTGPDYSVAYAMGDSPFGPFKRIGKILQQDPGIATGAGHHSVINIPGTDDWYIVYHRRPLTTKNGNHRETCIDRMYFDKDGLIVPVKITTEGVESRKLK
jgi:beta-xylosidase